MSSPTIHIQPARPSDFLSLATLEARAFATDAFTALAFGPHRFSDVALEERAAQLGSEPRVGEEVRNMKAVLTLEGTEEIVGFANWYFCIGRMGSEEERGRLGVREGWGEGAEAGKGENGEGGKNPWGPGANALFCEDVFVKGDAYMARATSGFDYAKLTTLVVAPTHQRRGIGTLLFKAFLAETDGAGLQAVLGASREGIALYRRNGFLDHETMDLNLDEYEGGGGMGKCEHVIMWRPAVRR